MEKYWIGIAGIVGLMVIWGLIQQLWRRIFSDETDDPDVLANRLDCGSCGCQTPCIVKKIRTIKNKQ